MTQRARFTVTPAGNFWQVHQLLDNGDLYWVFESEDREVAISYRAWRETAK